MKKFSTYEPKTTEKDDWIFVTEEDEDFVFKLFFKTIPQNDFRNLENQTQHQPTLVNPYLYPSISESNYFIETQNIPKIQQETDLSTKPLPNFDFDFEKSFLFQPSTQTVEQPMYKNSNVVETIPTKEINQESLIFEKFVKLGFSQDLILFAMEVYLDSSLIENFLNNFKNLTDFGFGELKVKEALLLKENNFEEALDFLTKE
jgi:hypothetical protein